MNADRAPSLPGVRTVPRGACASLHPDTTVHLVGDSTVADKPVKPPQPERGWGQLIQEYACNPKTIVNHAKDGASSKSFIDEGHWERVRSRLKAGDYVFVQFGHNDQKKEDPARYADARTDYCQNMIRFVRESRNQQAIPVLVTPVCRRRFDQRGRLVDTHGHYPKSVRDIAKSERVPLIDLHQESAKLLGSLGAEASKALFLWVGPHEYATHPEGIKDNTHFSRYGAQLMAKIIIRSLKESELPIAGAFGTPFSYGAGAELSTRVSRQTQEPPMIRKWAFDQAPKRREKPGTQTSPELHV
jgi:DNA sulfur modification protein DndE